MQLAMVLFVHNLKYFLNHFGKMNQIKSDNIHFMEKQLKRFTVIFVLKI